MRLDEWQKYIGSQFLDDEPQPVPASKTAAPVPLEVAGTASAAPVQELREEPVPATPVSEKPTSEKQDVPAVTPGLPEPRYAQTPLAGARPETTPNAIQNVVTMVVAPSVQTETLVPSPRAPRIELLTPLPEQTLPPTNTEPVQEVNNRTRRRSQNTLVGTAQEANTVTGQTTESSTPLVSEPAPESNPSSNPFQPILNLDADIPSFAHYLPPTHAASLPAANTASNMDADLIANSSVTFTEPLSSSSSNPASRTENPITQAQHAQAQPEEAATEVTQPEELPTEDTETLQDTGSMRRTPRSRARHARNIRPDNVPSGMSASELWATVPRHVQTLLALERLEEEQEVAQFSYKRPFQEKRHELIERLLDPILSLEDAARLLNVCPTTVRRYTNKGILTYYRKEPERGARSTGDSNSSGDKETRQRRFRLSDILAFLETQQAALAADRQAERIAGLPDEEYILDTGKDG